MYFDRFDICGAYLALENDWNVGGWLRERPSNQRRRESIGVQLHRMQFRPARDACCAFEYLQNDNQRAIYVAAARRLGLPLSPDDETHAAVLAFEASAQEWSGSPCPDDPDNFWIDDATGERRAAS
jgi:hypothetical protein